MLERGSDLPADWSENDCSLLEPCNAKSACLAVICMDVWPAMHVATTLQSLSKYARSHFSIYVE